MTHEIDAWLASIGLLQHAAAFHANHIDAAMLPRLTAEDLKEIGVASLGHRKKMLEAIAGMGRAVPPEDAPHRSAQGEAAPLRPLFLPLRGRSRQRPGDATRTTTRRATWPTRSCSRAPRWKVSASR